MIDKGAADPAVGWACWYVWAWRVAAAVCKIGASGPGSGPVPERLAAPAAPAEPASATPAAPAASAPAPAPAAFSALVPVLTGAGGAAFSDRPGRLDMR